MTQNAIGEAAANTAAAEGALAAAGLGPPQPSEWWSTQDAMTMCSVVLAFSLIVLLLASYLIKLGKTATSVLQIFGTILVITMATFLVVAGYNDEQVSAPMGLLGTIVGYLLGRGSSDRTVPLPDDAAPKI